MFFIYSHIRKSGILDPVVIDAEDKDVVVLSAFVGLQPLFFCQPLLLEGLLAIKQKKGIINCRDLCPKDVADIIVPLHIFSGCDTTSGFYGHGKKTVYDKVTKSQEACSLLKQVGKQLSVTNWQEDCI